MKYNFLLAAVAMIAVLAISSACGLTATATPTAAPTITESGRIVEKPVSAADDGLPVSTEVPERPSPVPTATRVPTATVVVIPEGCQPSSGHFEILKQGHYHIVVWDGIVRNTIKWVPETGLLAKNVNGVEEVIPTSSQPTVIEIRAEKSADQIAWKMTVVGFNCGGNFYYSPETINPGPLKVRVYIENN